MIEIIRYLHFIQKILKKSMLIGELTRRDIRWILENPPRGQSQGSYVYQYIQFLKSLRLMKEIKINENQYYLITSKGRNIFKQKTNTKFAISLTIPQYLSHLKILKDYNNSYIRHDDEGLNESISLKNNPYFYNSSYESNNFQWYRHWDHTFRFCSSLNMNRDLRQDRVCGILDEIDKNNIPLEFNYEYISPLPSASIYFERLYLLLIIFLIVGGNRSQKINLKKFIECFSRNPSFQHEDFNLSKALDLSICALNKLGIDICRDNKEINLVRPIRFFVDSSLFDDHPILNSFEVNDWTDFSEDFFNRYFTHEIFSEESNNLELNRIYLTSEEDNYILNYDLKNFSSLDDLISLLPKSPAYQDYNNYGYRDKDLLNIFYNFRDEITTETLWDYVAFLLDKQDRNENLLRSLCLSKLLIGKLPIFNLKQYYRESEYKNTLLIDYISNECNLEDKNKCLIGLFFYYQPYFRILINILILRNKEEMLDIDFKENDYYMRLGDADPVLLIDIIEKLLKEMKFKIWNELYCTKIEKMSKISKILMHLCEKLNIIISSENLEFTNFFKDLYSTDFLEFRNNDVYFRIWILNKLEQLI